MEETWQLSPSIVMNAISWNYRGLGNPRVVLALKELIYFEKSNLVFLMETLITSTHIEEIPVALGYSGAFSVDREDHSGGLVVF